MNAEARKREGTAGENRESFFRRFELKITPDDRMRLDRAYRWAKEGHRRQPRETGARYFEHLRAAALILVCELEITDVELIIAVLLHDIVEDSYMLSLEDIRFNFGDRVARIVKRVTKPSEDDPRFKSKEARDAWYHADLAKAEWDELVAKLADRLQNTRSLGSCRRDKRLRKAKETREHFLPLAKRLAEKIPRVGNFFFRETDEALGRLNL